MTRPPPRSPLPPHPPPSRPPSRCRSQSVRPPSPSACSSPCWSSRPHRTQTPSPPPPCRSPRFHSPHWPWHCYPPALSPRSEEHTSELQSPHHLVSRLLLEKK